MIAASSPIIDLTGYINKAVESNPLKVYGRIVEITGLLIKAVGLNVSVGDAVRIYPAADPMTPNSGAPINAEVMGFKDDKALLMATGELAGISPGTRVMAIGKKVTIRVSHDIMGRIVNDSANPIDGKGPVSGEDYSLHMPPPSPITRRRITEPLNLGIRAINGLLTCGKGQRIGIMAGAGVGKSVLLGMMARYTNADVSVIALIGERGREVREFIERDLGASGLKKSVVVVSTSEQPPVAKVRCAFTATAIAEWFRNQGMEVALFMDSLTRVAMAQREIGLAVGEPPTAKGYTPSVFSLLPKLLEKAGTAEGKGSITGIYTVLVEADDLTDPVADASMAVLDGHIVLSRDLMMHNHYPAIDILSSISRLMPDIIDDKHKTYSNKFITTLATYIRFEDMINLGAYKAGTNPDVDYAIKMIDKINEYLMQDMNEEVNLTQSIEGLYRLFDEQQAETPNNEPNNETANEVMYEQA